MKKIIVAMILILLAVTMTFVGCGDKYKSLKLDVSVDEVTIVLEELGDTENLSEEQIKEQEETLNVEEFTAKLIASDKKISKKVLFGIEDESIANISYIVEDGLYTVSVKGLMPGQTKITILSAEGNKKKVIDLKIVLPAKSMKFNANIRMAQPVGSQLALNVADLIAFAPENTNQKNVTWSIDSDAGVIDEHNVLTINSIPNGNIINLKATNNDNEELFDTTPIYVYTPLNKENVLLTDKSRDAVIDWDEVYTLAKNSAMNACPMEIDLGAQADNFVVYAESGNKADLMIEKVTGSIFNFVGVQNGRAEVQFRIGLVGYTVQAWTVFDFDLNIVDIVNKILINDSDEPQSITVYDKYVSSSLTDMGTRIKIDSTPNNAENKVVSFEVPATDRPLLEYFDIRSDSGSLITDLSTHTIYGSGSIYIKALEASVRPLNITVKANVEFNQGENLVTNSMVINVKDGVTDINFYNENLLYVDLGKNYVENNFSTWAEIPYTVNGKEYDEFKFAIDLASLKASTLDASVLKANVVDGKLYLMPLKEGQTVLTLRSTNGYGRGINVKVVTPTNDIKMNVDTQKYKDIVTSVEKDENNELTQIYSENYKFFNLEFLCLPINGTLWDLQYSATDLTVATVNQSGYVYVVGVGTTKINISGKYASYNENNELEILPFQKSVNLTTFNPLKRFSIGQDWATIYDFNGIGSLDADTYSTVNFNILMNNATILPSDVEYSIVSGDLSNGVLTDFGDGKAKFVGKLGDSNLVSANVVIKAYVNEFGREYSSFCRVQIKKTINLSKISLLNVDEDGIYFKAGDGLNTINNSFTIQSKVEPSNATNDNLYYFAYEKDDEDNIIESSKVEAWADGTIIPKEIGNCYIRVVPRSVILGASLESATPAEILRCCMESSVYRDVIVNVANGELNNPFKIYNIAELMQVAQGLQYHYVLANTLDLSNINWTPLGSSTNPFTGSLNGRMEIIKINNNGEQVISYIDSQIIGLNLVNQNIALTSDGYYGLFGKVKGEWDEDFNRWQFNSISNLTLQVRNIDLKVVSAGTASMLYYGAVVGLLDGGIKNVNVVYTKNVIIETEYQTEENTKASPKNVFVGGLLGYSNRKSDIDNRNEINVNLCTVKNYNNVAINVVDSISTIFVGGLVGLNYGRVIGEYSYINNATGGEAIVFAKVSYENSIMDCAIDIRTNNANENSAIGGVVGKNAGYVNNVSQSGIIANININGDNIECLGYNVGGIVGMGTNTSEIMNVQSTAMVYGASNVGGIVGYNEGDLSWAVFEKYPTTTAFEKLFGVVGYNNVGGLVGQQNGATMTYCYSTDYWVDDALDDAVTIYASVGDTTYVGGAIGLAKSANILNIWSNLNIQMECTNSFAGGLIGGMQGGELSSSYSRAYIESNGFDKAGLVGKLMRDGGSALPTITQTYAVTNLYNFAVTGTFTPVKPSFFNYTDGGQTAYGNAIAKSEEDLKLDSTYKNIGSWWSGLDMGEWIMGQNINDGFPALTYVSGNQKHEFASQIPNKIEIFVKDSEENSFIRVDDNKAVVFINKNATTGEVEEIDLNNILNIKTTPILNNILYARVEILEGYEKIMLQDNIITPLAEGLVRLKISSYANPNANAEVQFYFAYGVNDIEILYNNKSCGSADNPLIIQKGSAKELTLNKSNSVGEGLGAKNYITNERVGFAIQYHESLGMSYSSIMELDGVDYSYITSENPIILNGLLASNAIINATVFGLLNVHFLEDGGYKNSIVFVPQLEKHFNYSVIEGATELTLKQYGQGLTPNESAEVFVNIKTDIATDFVGKINIYNNGDLFDEFTIEKNATLSDAVIEDFVITNVNKNFDIRLIKITTNREGGAVKSIDMVFEIGIAEDLKEIETALNYNFVFVTNGKEESDTKLAKTWVLDLLPQNILKITPLHFANGILDKDEVASDYIGSGVSGLLKINIYPYFSQVDYLEITSSDINGEHITFNQAILHEELNFVDNGEHYLFQTNQIIENGIQLKLISKIINEENQQYEYDGNLYVRTILKSGLAENLPFTITIKAIKNNKAVFTQEKVVYTQFTPSVDFRLTGEDDFNIARGTTLELPLNVMTMAGELSLSSKVLDRDNNDVTSLYMVQTNDNVIYGGKFVGTYLGFVKLAIDIPAGYTVKVNVNLRTAVNNVEFSISDELSLTVADFVIKDLYISGAINNSLKINLNEAYTLKAKAVTTSASQTNDGFGLLGDDIYKTHYDKINEKIVQFEEEVSKTFALWYRADKTPWLSIFDTNEQASLNYKVATAPNTISIIGKKVNDDSKIGIDIKYTYKDLNGVYGVVIDTKNEESEVIRKDYVCVVDVQDSSTEDNPKPIYEVKEFKEMTDGVHYILMNDLELEQWVPENTHFASLDGNGKVIKINSFSLDWMETKQGEKQVGLWTIVESGTILKNLIIDVDEIYNSNAEYYLNGNGTVYFGFIAGINEGTITNCDVLRLSNVANDGRLTLKTDLIYNQAYTENYLAGFVGVNKGFITNSRVGSVRASVGTYVDESNNTVGSINNITIIANSNVAGFVGKNENTISSSSVENVYISNSSNIGAQAQTAGFVVENGIDAKIASCFVTGQKIYTDEGALLPNLISLGNIASFVMYNKGEIINTYADCMMKTPMTAIGFVYKNEADSIIENSFTVSDYIEYEGEGEGSVFVNISAFRPFTGVDDFNMLLNDGTIKNCYYRKNNTSISYSSEVATGLSADDMKSMDYFVGFATVKTSANMAGQGIWLSGDSGVNGESEFEHPILYNTLQGKISVSSRSLVEKEEDTDTFIYQYNEGYEVGTEINPKLISRAEEFNNINKDVRYVEGAVYKQSYIRIIKDLDFKATSDTAGGLYSSNKIFTGYLDGNSMDLSNIRLTGQFAIDNEEVKLDEFGFFARLDNALIKNIDFDFTEVSATDFGVVGGLAGLANDSIVMNVNIDSEEVGVQGKNVTGGLIGLVTGNSQVQNIKSNISARSTYRAQEIGMTGIDEEKIYYLKDPEALEKEYVNLYEIDKVNGALSFDYKTAMNNRALPTSKVSYAGGIIGALTNYTKQLTSNVLNLYVYESVSVAGERVGGAIGLVGKNSILYDASFVINQKLGNVYKQELSGLQYTGGIVGENLGTIYKSRVTYEGDDLDTMDNAPTGSNLGKTNVFIGKIEYAGGLVGYNSGMIQDSYSRIDIVDDDADYIGGVVGLCDGGAYNSIYASGNVFGKIAGGGIIGKATSAKITDFTKVVAVNNYSFATVNYIQSNQGKDGTFVLGALIGYYEDVENVVPDINQAFAENLYAKYTNNYSVKNIPLNSNGTQYYEMPYIASYNGETILQELNDKIDGMGTHTGFVNVGYEIDELDYDNIFYEGAESIFAKYDTNSWVTSGKKFPQLRITVQQTAIIIDDDNKKDLLTLMQNNLNGYFVFTVDVILKDLSDDGDLNIGTNNVWQPVGSAGAPFTGTIRGQGIEDGDNVRNPKIYVPNNKNFLGECLASQIFSMDFETISTSLNVEMQYSPNSKKSYGLIVNYAKNTRFEDVNISGHLGINVYALEAIANIGIDINNYYGGAIGWAENCSIVSVVSNLNIGLTEIGVLKNAALEEINVNDYQKYRHYLGGVVGYALNSEMMGCQYVSAMNIKACNATVGGVVARSSGTKMTSLALSSSASIDYTYTSPNEVSKLFVFGGIIGENVNYKSLEASVNDMIELKITEITVDVDIIIGGLVGKTSSELTIRNSKNECNITVEKNKAENIYALNNEIYVGGIIGQVTVSTYLVSVSNTGNINIAYGGDTYIGGLIGKSTYAITSDSLNLLTTSFNVGDITFVNHTKAYVGGLIGCVDNGSNLQDTSRCNLNTSYSDCDIISYASTNLTSENIGGIVGSMSNHARVNNCFSVGTIMTYNTVNTEDAGKSINIGGLVGENNGKIFTSYSIVFLNASEYQTQNNVHINGLVGNLLNLGGVYSSFYAGEHVWGFDTSGATLKSYADMLNRATYEKTAYIWQFGEYWEKEDGLSLPYIKGLKPFNAEDTSSIYKPKQIATDEELANITNSGYYLIVNDIAFTDTSNQLRLENFNGYINGGGFKLDCKDYAFATAFINNLNSSAKLSNINIINATKSNNNILVENNAGLISYVSVQGQILLTSEASGKLFGGIAGVNTGSINNSFAYVDILSNEIIANTSIGGLAGKMENTENYSFIYNCFSSGALKFTPTLNSFVGGLVGLFNSGKIENSYCNGVIRIDGDETSGFGSIYGKKEGNDTKAILKSVYNENLATTIENIENGVTKVSLKNSLKKYKEESENGNFGNMSTNVWGSWAIDSDDMKNINAIMYNSGSPYLKNIFKMDTLDYLNCGNGILSNSNVTPYLIKNGSQFEIMEYISSKEISKQYKIINNIYLSSEFVGVDKLNGVLDGNSKIISDFNLKSSVLSRNNFAFIGINNGTIKELNFNDSSININSTQNIGTQTTINVGSLCAVNNGIITNVKVKNAKVAVNKSGLSLNTNIGGIIGSNNSTKIDGDSVTRLLADNITLNINAQINGDKTLIIGGVVGLHKSQKSISQVKISNVTIEGVQQNIALNTGAKVTHIGAFAGSCDGGRISQSAVKENVNINVNYEKTGIPAREFGTQVGGFVGFAKGRIDDCYVNSVANTILATSNYTGSFAGVLLDATINTSYTKLIYDFVKSEFSGATSQLDNVIADAGKDENYVAVKDICVNKDIWDQTSIVKPNLPTLVWENIFKFDD